MTLHGRKYFPNHQAKSAGKNIQKISGDEKWADQEKSKSTNLNHKKKQSPKKSEYGKSSPTSATEKTAPADEKYQPTENQPHVIADSMNL